MNQDSKKKNAAEAAFDLIKPKLNKDTVLGIGTGSTTNFFIHALNSLNAVSYTHLTLPTICSV